jgi:hypothetical protein
VVLRGLQYCCCMCMCMWSPGCMCSALPYPLPTWFLKQLEYFLTVPLRAVACAREPQQRQRRLEHFALPSMYAQSGPKALPYLRTPSGTTPLTPPVAPLCRSKDKLAVLERGDCSGVPLNYRAHKCGRMWLLLKVNLVVEPRLLRAAVDQALLQLYSKSGEAQPGGFAPAEPAPEDRAALGV